MRRSPSKRTSQPSKHFIFVFEEMYVKWSLGEWLFLALEIPRLNQLELLQQEYHKLDGLKDKHVFLTFLEIGKFRICQQLLYWLVDNRLLAISSLDTDRQTD